MLDAFADLETRGLSSSHQAEAETVRDQLLADSVMQATREGDDRLPLDSRRLDETAADVAVEARFRSSSAKQRGNVVLSGILDNLATRLESADCFRCAVARGSTTPCGQSISHERVDHGLVDQRGECLTDIMDLYDFTVELGSSLYSNAWSDDGPVGFVDLRLRTRMLAPNTPVPGYARLTARTDFETEGGRHQSLITLSIDGTSYGAFERDTAAYFLIHEIIAHAFYDAFLIGERSHRDPYDLWAEGWMDCIAADVLTEALKGSSAYRAPPARMRANQLAVDAVYQCHAERYVPVPGAKSHALNDMRLARTRYQTMRYRLQALNPRSTFNAMRSIHLACAIINANGANFQTVAAVNSAANAFVFAAKGGSDLTDEELRVYHALASFVGHRDEKRLIGELT